VALKNTRAIAWNAQCKEHSGNGCERSMALKNTRKCGFERSIFSTIPCWHSRKRGTRVTNVTRNWFNLLVTITTLCACWNWMVPHWHGREYGICVSDTMLNDTRRTTILTTIQILRRQCATTPCFPLSFRDVLHASCHDQTDCHNTMRATSCMCFQWHLGMCPMRASIIKHDVICSIVRYTGSMCFRCQAHAPHAYNQIEKMMIISC